MDPQSSPDPDVVFDLLADADRRAVLSVLRDHGALDERSLARRVAGRCDDATPDSDAVPVDAFGGDLRPRPDADERVDAVQTALWHVHLPKLDATTLVDHDPAGGCVEPGPALEAVEPLLAYAEEHEADAGTTA